MAERKPAELNAVITEEKVSPLSLPLDKENTMPDENKSDADNPESKDLKRVSQKKFADIILKRVDERIAQRRSRRRMLPGLGIILIVLFAAPFFFRAGSDIYDILKSRLPSLEFYGLDFSSAPAGDTPENEAINLQIAGNLNKLLKLQEKLLKKSTQKVVVIYPERAGTFSFKREKKRLYELSGLDIDDPIQGSKVIEKIKSVELLVAMVESFDRIIDNAGRKNEVSGFHVKNSIEGKRMALKKIRQLR